MSEWRRVRVVDLCEAHVDCVNRTAPVVDGPTPYKMIRTTNVRGGFIDTDNVRYVTEETYVRWTRRMVPRPGDVVLTREAPLGDVGKVRTSDRIFLGQRLYHFRPDPNLADSDFLMYSLMGPDLQGQIKAFGSGSTVEHMRLGDIEELELDLPSLEVQRRIAGILSAYDDLIENCERRIRVLDEMARALYREWFVNFRYPGHENVPLVDSPLGPAPEGWSVKRLVDVTHLTMGQSPKSEFYNQHGEGLPFHQGVSDFGARFPEDRVFCTAEARTAEAGDILFSVRAPVGRMNVAPRRLALGRGLSAIRHREGEQAFLWEQLRARFTREDMIGNGAIFAAVTKQEMQAIELLVPPRALVADFRRLAEPLHADIASLDASKKTLSKTRDLLLPRLLSGQLSVEDVA